MNAGHCGGRIPGSVGATLHFDYHSLNEMRFIQFLYIAESGGGGHLVGLREPKKFLMDKKQDGKAKVKHGASLSRARRSA